MKRAKIAKFSILTFAFLVASIAQAGSYMILSASSCSLIKQAEVKAIIDRVGIAQNLDLPANMAIRGELRCINTGLTLPGSVFSYTFRTTIEKKWNDDGKQRWAAVAEWTAFGITDDDRKIISQIEESVASVIKAPR
jgi:hypothetical protein